MYTRILGLLALVAAPLSAQLPPLAELAVPKPPTVASADGKSFLVYELHVTNFTAAPVVVRRIEVVDGGVGPRDGPGRTLVALEDSALARALARPGAAPPPAPMERARLGGGLRAVAFLWVPVDGRTLPASLRHRITFAPASSDGAAQTILGPSVPVMADAVVIGPPLRGGVWLAANGPDSLSGHRRALVPVDGIASIAQRFAIDYLKIDEQNRSFTGDESKNETHYTEGADVIAVADGTVAATHDGIPENVPGINSRAVPITLETVGGNFVILDIGRGRYAFYAHLKPGSLRVRQGERVRRGQLLGFAGNSGNSTEPHLHFHVSDAPSPLGSQGLPYAVDAFELVGRCSQIFTGCTRPAPVTRRREQPMANMLIRFPN